ncbi:sugar ABC transporter permease [Litorilinea aerophila]|uniref:Sugar ABC transporter permease n=1 Tax=Litorilinea aerophila TaxID=1204385 RepID=A0A540VA43_9CHLR|nr:sugar ABC transporter permease [Litorilinea aerophila]MCC9078562.1 sugar ABC transporter permease [Litorilinea aerophila]OUC07513.1 ABC transporter permease [Litorilinea aerophila]GIV79905.1 MAG: putative ABC transporter permease protein YesP [Litorilinea sp.]
MGYLFISPWLIGFFVWTLIPIGASLVLSFTDYNILAGAPNWVGFQNFQKMFLGDPRYWRAVKATFYFTFASVPLKLAFALAVAMVLNRARAFVGVYRAMYYAPSIVGGSIAVAVMWREIFGSNGLFNALLALVGLPGRAWLGDPATAIWTLILLAVWQFGSPMLIFLAGLKHIPPEFYEAASIDGAGFWAKFLRITLPLLTPVIFFNLVMQLIYGFMTFTQAYVITGGKPLDTTLFYNLYVFNRAFHVFELGYGAAMSWVLLAVIAVVTGLMFRFSRYWVFYEAAE